MILFHWMTHQLIKSESEITAEEETDEKEEEIEVAATSLPSTLSELAALPSGYTDY